MVTLLFLFLVISQGNIQIFLYLIQFRRKSHGEKGRHVFTCAYEIQTLKGSSGTPFGSKRICG